tara:strand:- start:68 stop:586 length:519 start_codon:yes stop_codon:yes gene_type:complete
MKKITTIFVVTLLISCGLTSCNEEADIEAKMFAEKFYSSLELSSELNQKHYSEGGVTFNMDNFNSLIDKSSIYSKERVGNLTGHYHDRYYINLVGIESIEVINNKILVTTTVEYSIYEIGTFQNEEKLWINRNQDKLILAKWEDIKVKKMEVSEYDGLENFDENSFYQVIGI